MKKLIPGLIDEEGREFFYIEIFAREGFDKIADGALAGSPDVPLPEDGGVLEEKAKILLDSHTSLLGLSYRGDLPGWRANLVAYCKATNRIWGIVSDKRLLLSDGRDIALCECDVVFED